jgi:hypothetical protein
MSDDPNALLDLLNSLDEESKLNEVEPGVIWKPSIFVPGARFKSFTRDAAGADAWMKAAVDVADYQKSVAPKSADAPEPAAEQRAPILRIVRV